MGVWVDARLIYFPYYLNGHLLDLISFICSGEKGYLCCLL